MTRDGTVESISRDQILRRERGQGKIQYLWFLAVHEQDWQPYPVDPYSAISNDHTYILADDGIYILHAAIARIHPRLFRDREYSGRWAVTVLSTGLSVGYRKM